MDVTERRLAEDWLRLTARELQHRVKNTLSIVQSIAAQSFRSAESKEEGVAAFLGRLRALGTATDLLTGGNWTTVRVGEVVAEVLLPFRDAEHDRFELSGSEVEIDGKNAAALALALHELSTNAVKYGALSTQAGRVTILWGREGDVAFLNWQESGGPRIDANPTWSGFGTRMLSRRLFNDGEGSIIHEFRPDGVYCRISIMAPGQDVAPSPQVDDLPSWPEPSVAGQGRGQ
jgi:two-component sensor histidine kinase